MKTIDNLRIEFKKIHTQIWITLWVVGIPGFLFCQNPGTHWMQYTSPEEAGWSSEILHDVGHVADSIGSSAFMIIEDGKIVAQFGETNRKFMCHSVRKSLLTALYGFYVDSEQIDLQKTLKALDIDDIHELSDQEKTATIEQLLQARSGVYHPAAYETEAMKKARPARNSHDPGSFWYYNNWDFNTACHILMEHSGKDFFEDFKEKIAEPLQMEDFTLDDTYYHLEAEHSQYPAYPFRMSARDLARIGQWFLQDGVWSGEQLISHQWIDRSTTSYSSNVRRDGTGYGYMWWTGIYGDTHKNYSAQGVGNQAIIVFPEHNVVMVNRANTYKGERVKTSDLQMLTKLAWTAKTEKMKDKPTLIRSRDLSRYDNDVNSVDNILTALYEVISGEKGEKRDWVRFKNLFIAEARLIPTSKTSDGTTGYDVMSPDQFIQNAGAYFESSGFYEKEIHRVTEQYGSIVHAFSTYDSFHTKSDKEPFARGINSIQLMHDGDRWWVVQIFWLGESEDNPIPSKYLPK